MEVVLTKLFAVALALSEVTTAPQAVKTHFDPVQDRAKVVQILRDGCAHMRQAFDIELINLDDLIATAYRHAPELDRPRQNSCPLLPWLEPSCDIACRRRVSSRTMKISASMVTSVTPPPKGIFCWPALFALAGSGIIYALLAQRSDRYRNG